MKLVQRIVVGVSLLFICGLLISAVVPNVPSGTWQATGDMAAPRTGATATVFPDGRLMIVGGNDANGEPLATAEFYNADGSISAAPSMSIARSGHAAIFLYDGRLLVAGGRVSGGGITNSAEVFDPLTNHWQTLSTTLLNARAGHTVSQLQDGSVLIAGGEDSSGPVSALEVFDLYNNFNAAGSLNTARKDHAAAVLPDGRVLLAGGLGYAADSSLVTLNTTEIYDPNTNSVTAGPAMSVARAKHSATTLLDGRILIAGGNNGSNDLASAEIYNPATGAITATASLSAPRSGHTALLLPNNNAVLIAGGTSAGNDVATAELYESWNNAFKSTGSMTAARTGAAASATSYDGLAMLAGGSNLASTELYGYATVKTDKHDYAPGEVVTITGSGWQAGELVSLILKSSSGATYPSLTAAADASGTIYSDQFSPSSTDFGVQFFLTAKGTASEAHATFHDAANISAATVTTKDSTCTTSTSSFSRGQTVCANVDITGVTGPLPGDFYIVWFNPSNVAVQATLKAVPSTVPTSFTDTFGTTSSTPTGLWRVGACRTAACTGGNQIASANFTITVADTSPPDTTITANPTALTNSTSASFSFTATESPATFECKLDSGSFAACAGPQNYLGLADGSHTFQVRAKDAANNVDPTPASYTWVVDTGAPDTTITSNPVTLTNSTSASFSFTATESPSTFECKLDAGAFAACTSPQSYSGLLEGSHTFQARAKDSADNVDATPASYTWTIDTTAPTFSGTRVTPANSNGWNNDNVDVSFTCTDANGIGSINITSGATGTSPSSPFQVTVVTEGVSQAVNATCIDAAGNSDTAFVSNINIDKTDPTLGFDPQSPAANGNGWNNTNVSFGFTASDALSGVDTTNPAASPLVLTSEGSAVTGTVTVTDKAGNSKTFTSPTVKIDKTKPSASGSPSPVANSNGWNNSDVTVSFTGSDSLSGIDTCVSPVVLSTEGANQSASGTCTDEAGNISDPANVTGINIDKTAPTASGSRAPAANAHGWNNTDVTVSFSGSDGLSGIDFCAAAVILSSEGANQSASGTCTDKAGNVSASASVTDINIDKTDPTLAFDPQSPAANGNGWNNTNVSFGFTASDALSGVNTTNPATSPLVLASEGSAVTGTVTVTDKAGNSKTFTSPTVKIDKTKPTASATPSPSANSNGWNNTDVTVSFSGTDSGGSGIASCSASVVLSTEGTGQSASGTCTDEADNLSETATASGINIDKTAPTASASASPAPNSYGWNNGNVTVSFVGSDGLSGIDFCTSNTILSTEAANQSASGNCTDKAGNVSTPTGVSGINIDKTQPELNPAVTPNPAILNGTATSASNATDSLSGVRVQSCPSPNLSSVGQKSLTCSAEDFAGNQASASVNYSVQYLLGGSCLGSPGHAILQPINYPVVTSVFKQKSTVPAKFRVCDANGTSIGIPGVVVSFKLISMSAGTVDSTNEVVESTTPDTAFRWDLTAQQWIFNMNTKSLSPNVTYGYRILLNDGTWIDFGFGLK